MEAIIGTVWVCQDCLLHHANGECGSCYDDDHGHDETPLNRFVPGEVAMGMASDEHSCGRENGEDVPECDCETNTFSTSECKGCGSYLHGERHAMTRFDMPRYKVIRFYKEHPSISQRTLKKGLTRKEAIAHCSDPEASSSTCVKRVNVRRTEWIGPWFDGWTEK